MKIIDSKKKWKSMVIIEIIMMKCQWNTVLIMKMFDND